MVTAAEQALALRGTKEPTQPLRVDAFYTASFTEPLYPLLGTWRDTYQALYPTFADLGLRPEDIRWEGGKQPSEAQVACNLAQLGVVFRFRVMELEVWTTQRGIIRDETMWRPLLRRGHLALQALNSPAGIALHTFTLGLHWRTDEGVAQVIGRLATSSLSDFRIGSVVLTLESAPIPTQRGNIVPKISLEVQRSIVFSDPDAVFARIACEISGDVPLDEACPVAESAIRSSREQAGIDLDI